MTVIVAHHLTLFSIDSCQQLNREAFDFMALDSVPNLYTNLVTVRAQVNQVSARWPGHCSSPLEPVSSSVTKCGSPADVA